MPSEYLAFCEHPTDRPTHRPTEYKMQEGRRETLQLPAVQRERERESARADSSNVVGRFALQYTQIISAVMISLLATAAADAVRDLRTRQKCELFAVVACI